MLDKLFKRSEDAAREPKRAPDAPLSVVFVGGCQRTGTTVVQGLLCSDEKVNPMPAEAGYLDLLMNAYAAATTDFDFSTQHYFDTPESFATFHGAWIREFLAHTLARYRPAETLVLKEPHLTTHFPRLAQLLPEAKFIVMVRDPRDTIASMRDVGGRLLTTERHRDRTIKGARGLSIHFLSFYKACLRHEHDGLRGRLLFVRYEDLVSKPAEVIAQLAAFTGLKLDAADPADPWKRQVRPVDQPHERQKPWRTSLHGGPLVADSVGRYRNALSPQEARIVVKTLADFCQRFGYASQ
jgi:hypothetical protein